MSLSEGMDSHAGTLHRPTEGVLWFTAGSCSGCR